ncbi:hypothetical protein HY229_03500 [Candidatus Acetothermia bacterium]|nr:hypothetical protein [Candidatus Acetothermia bacterium]MBI3643149.1 hypothetical protein [Candidatus Acetothermia bacterium]
MENTTRLTLGGSSYGLVGIGVGLAVSSWGTPFFESAISGLCWPATLAYWLVRLLHHAAS